MSFSRERNLSAELRGRLNRETVEERISRDRSAGAELILDRCWIANFGPCFNNDPFIGDFCKWEGNFLAHVASKEDSPDVQAFGQAIEVLAIPDFHLHQLGLSYPFMPSNDWYLESYGWNDSTASHVFLSQLSGCH